MKLLTIFPENDAPLQIFHPLDQVVNDIASRLTQKGIRFEVEENVKSVSIPTAEQSQRAREFLAEVFDQ